MSNTKKINMDLPGRLGSVAAAALLVAEGVDMPDTVVGRAVYW
jgi:hypothetical protein